MKRRFFIVNSLQSAALSVAALRADQRVAAKTTTQRLQTEQKESEAKATSKTMLFFDDWPLNRLDHVERRIGRPTPVTESVFVDPYVNVTWGYPSVFKDPSRRAQWQCLYQGWDAKRERLYPLIAESEDGIVWRVPDLSAEVDLPGRAYPHQVLPVEEFNEWSPCYYDERAPSDERLKGLVVAFGKDYAKSYLWVSADGRRWRRKEGVIWQPEAPDPVSCVFWNSVRSSYVITTRPMGSDRRISLIETKDWRNFSSAELALQTDAQDTPLAEAYGMPVFFYEGFYIGLLWIYHVTPEVAGASPHKFWRGKIDAQLAYSRNGWHFQRGLRERFMPNAEPGEFGAGCLQPASMVIDEKDRIRIYSSATKFEHGVPIPGDGAIIQHTMRRDGFVYLQSTGGPGTIGTRPLLWQGGPLKINLAATGGEAHVQITDSAGTPLTGYAFNDCEPFAGDALYWQPRWKEGRSLASFPERTLRIEVRLSNARLYAIRGQFTILTGAETTNYETRGERPKNKPGF
ncbi:MAG: hypothetical protein WKF30_06860 [Pyrinomonadaceae bacterium]